MSSFCLWWINRPRSTAVTTTRANEARHLQIHDYYLLSSSSNGAVSVWGIIELGSWTCRGTGQHNSKVSHIEFSQSGVHALTVDCFSIYIWGRDDCGLWSVKALLPTDNVRHAHFHPAAEHLVVLRDEYRFRIWEMGENDSHETSVSPGE